MTYYSTGDLEKVALLLGANTRYPIYVGAALGFCLGESPVLDDDNISKCYEELKQKGASSFKVGFKEVENEKFLPYIILDRDGSAFSALAKKILAEHPEEIKLAEAAKPVLSHSNLTELAKILNEDLRKEEGQDTSHGRPYINYTCAVKNSEHTGITIIVSVAFRSQGVHWRILSETESEMARNLGKKLAANYGLVNYSFQKTTITGLPHATDIVISPNSDNFAQFAANVFAKHAQSVAGVSSGAQPAAAVEKATPTAPVVGS